MTDSQHNQQQDSQEYTGPGDVASGNVVGDAPSEPEAALQGGAAVDEGSQVIVAQAGPRYRIPRYIMVGLFLIFAGLFIKDGFVTYPQQEQEFNRAVLMNKTPPRNFQHSDLDIRIQKILGIGLIPLAIASLVLILYRSRGEYRLEGDTLSVPGHPPITLDQLVRLDRRLWDRKGIADVYYVQPGGTEQRIRLDDFVYQPDPIDAIFERIQASFEKEAQGAGQTEES